MPAFDPQEFLNQQYDQSNDTAITPCPEGEHEAVTQQPTVEKVVSSKGETFWTLTVQCQIDDPKVVETTNRSPTNVRFKTFLDVILDSEGALKSLDMGKSKNVGLGRLREACGCNQPGKPFRLDHLAGRNIKVLVTHRADPNDATKIYDEVKSVRPV